MTLKTYRRPDGYTIKATPKAYNLFYKKQGFVEVKEEPRGEDVSTLSVKELKERLTVAGIDFKKNAKKEELVALLQGEAPETETEETEQESETPDTENEGAGEEDGTDQE